MVEMVSQKPINLGGTEATLRLHHQADRGRRRRLQTIQLKPWLIAKPLRQTETVHAHVVSGALRPRGRNAQGDQSQQQAAEADRSTDPCALAVKSLGLGPPRKPNKARASIRRITKSETRQTQAFGSFKSAVLFKLRLSASGWHVALTSFAVKVALFWLLELAFCK